MLLPARMSKADEREWVAVMVKRLADQERRRAGAAVRGDGELAVRAGELSRRYLEGRAQPSTVRWVTNQASRWGSCTPAEKSIRLSDRLRGMPSWVVDYVLVHELAHLLVACHGPAFHAWVDRYPQAERARGYLLGVSANLHQEWPTGGGGVARAGDGDIESDGDVIAVPEATSIGLPEATSIGLRDLRPAPPGRRAGRNRVQIGEPLF